jgi:hypothetical protein
VLPAGGPDDGEDGAAEGEVALPDGLPDGEVALPDGEAAVPGRDAGEPTLPVDALGRGLTGGEADGWPGEPFRVSATAVPAAAITTAAAASRPRGR